MEKYNCVLLKSKAFPLQQHLLLFFSHTLSFHFTRFGSWFVTNGNLMNLAFGREIKMYEHCSVLKNKKAALWKPAFTFMSLLFIHCQQFSLLLLLLLSVPIIIIVVVVVTAVIVFTLNSRVPNMHITHCNQCIYNLLKSAVYIGSLLLLLYTLKWWKELLLKETFSREEKQQCKRTNNRPTVQTLRFRYGFCTLLIALHTAHDYTETQWTSNGLSSLNDEGSRINKIIEQCIKLGDTISPPPFLYLALSLSLCMCFLYVATV